MSQKKSLLEKIDIFIKILIAIAGGLIVGFEKEQVDILKSKQTIDLRVTETLLPLIFGKYQCYLEDQSFFFDHLIKVNNYYSSEELKINKKEFLRASAYRRDCSNPAIVQDSKGASEGGSLPVVDENNIDASKKKLEEKNITIQRVSKSQKNFDTNKISGYVAIGKFYPDRKSFRNFNVPKEKIKDNGFIETSATVRPKWSVYLRTNITNTEQGKNPIIGVVDETSCAKVIESFPNTRGQTWASIRLISCD